MAIPISRTHFQIFGIYNNNKNNSSDVAPFNSGKLFFIFNELKCMTDLILFNSIKKYSDTLAYVEKARLAVQCDVLRLVRYALMKYKSLSNTRLVRFDYWVFFTILEEHFISPPDVPVIFSDFLTLDLTWSWIGKTFPFLPWIAGPILTTENLIR